MLESATRPPRTTMIEIGIVGGTGYTGVELLRLLAVHPQASVRVITSRKEAGMPVAEMFPSLRDMGAISDLRFSDPATRGPARLQCRVLRDTARRRHEPGARTRRRRRQDHRSGRRLPAQGSGRIRALVQDAALVHGPARRIGVRPARNASRRDRQGKDRRQSRLLSNGDPARFPAAGRGRASSMPRT